MRITIDLQPEDIKQALEEHIRDQTGFTADVSVDWLNGRYGVSVALVGDTPGIYTAPTKPVDEDLGTTSETKKRTRRSKEQIEADRLAEQGLDVTAASVGASEDTYYEPATEEPALDNQPGSVEPSESGLMATIFAEEPEVEEVVQDIFAVEDNSVFTQPTTENVFAIK